MRYDNIMPEWSRIEPGDRVTLELGTPGEDGYQLRMFLAQKNEHGSTVLNDMRVEIWSVSNWRLTKIERKAPEPQRHAGALAFSRKGMILNDGSMAAEWWNVNAGSAHSNSNDSDALGDVVPAAPVPLKELDALVVAVERGPGDHDILEAARKLVEEARGQWDRYEVSAQVKLPSDELTK